MKLLIIGNGGREHALTWKAAQSPKITQIFVAPGNPGTAREPKTTNVDIKATNIAALREFALSHEIGLTIVGPEAPLAAGIVDLFTAADLPCLGPCQKAAQLEASKTFSKDLMQRCGIPTARYANFTELAPALAYLEQQTLPIVIKADGLAAGKGVVIAHDHETARATVTAMLSGQAFGAAGQSIVIEEFIQGEEASFMALVDGEHILPLASSQDHKRRDDQDLGPNTGGMGAYSPAPLLTPALEQRALREVMLPVMKEMQRLGTPYRGFLYAGLMITPQQEIKVLEFNCRLGDPETQPILFRLRSDLIELCQLALAGRLHQAELKWDLRPALGVVLTSAGYPETSQNGAVIHGLTQSFGSDVKVFYAGVAEQQGQIVTAGGRVLCVTALGADLAAARDNAYAAVRKIEFAGMHYRTDIGNKALNLHSFAQS